MQHSHTVAPKILHNSCQSSAISQDEDVHGITGNPILAAVTGNNKPQGDSTPSSTDAGWVVITKQKVLLLLVERDAKRDTR